MPPQTIVISADRRSKKRAGKKACGSKGDQNIPAGSFADALVD
jgi:hypothetical protein